MRIYSTLLIHQKFLKANMGFVANDVSNFIALFIVIITDGKFFLIFKILNCYQPFNYFPSILQIKIFNIAYQVLWDLSLPSSPASLPIPSSSSDDALSLPGLPGIPTSQHEIAHALLSAWDLLPHITFCQVYP